MEKGTEKGTEKVTARGTEEDLQLNNLLPRITLLSGLEVYPVLEGLDEPFSFSVSAKSYATTCILRAAHVTGN